MNKPSVYLYPKTFNTSISIKDLSFPKYSYHHYNSVRQALLSHIIDYPFLPLRKASINDYLKVHSKQYLIDIINAAKGQSNNLSVSTECIYLEHCLPGYLYSLGGMQEAIDQMNKGLIKHAYCFSIGGHHSHKDWGHGYCLLNPQAAAIKYAQSQGFSKVLVIDWDIHHGDGTQSIFANDPSVHCISIHHAMDLYMAKISDLKAGTTSIASSLGHQNIPVLSTNFPKHILDLEGMTGSFFTSESILPTFKDSLHNLPWQPDFITIFSGYDSHKDDCGANITNFSNFSFCQLTNTLTSTFPSLPILSIHGGGYNLPITSNAALAHIQSLYY